jgi:3-phenylpropionate/cinnamic acid dioxygenase small subunit
MISNEEYRAIHEFYYLEAELLDDHNLEAWYGLLSPNIRYYAPLRAFYDRVEGRPYGDSPYFDDNYQSIKVRLSSKKRPNIPLRKIPIHAFAVL